MSVGVGKSRRFKSTAHGHKKTSSSSCHLIRKRSACKLGF